MYTPSFTSKQKHSQNVDTLMQYLVLPSESKDIAAAGRGSLGFRNRYLAKRRVICTIRRLRREPV